ncbi:MAG: hypothetical protein HOG05_05580, partial [Bacteroidetes bacterium]|nr:hypothetical protein [Bacteroidota bacterium]
MKTFKSKFLGLNFSACNKDDNETTENNTETSRDAFYGQDADYLKGEEMAYKDNGGETITDLIIGLMWIQDDNGEGILWQELQCYAEAKDFAGHSVPKIGDPT